MSDKTYRVTYSGDGVAVLSGAGKFMQGTSGFVTEAAAREAAARGDFIVEGLDGAPVAAPAPAPVAAPAPVSTPPVAAAAPVSTPPVAAAAPEHKIAAAVAGLDEKKAPVEEKKPEEPKAPEKPADKPAEKKA